MPWCQKYLISLDGLLAAKEDVEVTILQKFTIDFSVNEVRAQYLRIKLARIRSNILNPSLWSLKKLYKYTKAP